MPQATLTTTTVLAGLVLVLGCAERAVDERAPTRQTIQQPTTIGAPPVASDKAEPQPSPHPTRGAPEPAMSVPPPHESADPPASDSPPAAPIPPPPRYRNGCRPLVA